MFQERHWTSPGVAAALQAAMNGFQSDRLKQILNIAPQLLHVYFTIALRDANNCTFYVILNPFDILFSVCITFSTKLLLKELLMRRVSFCYFVLLPLFCSVNLCINSHSDDKKFHVISWKELYVWGACIFLKNKVLLLNFLLDHCLVVLILSEEVLIPL